MNSVLCIHHPERALHWQSNAELCETEKAVYTYLESQGIPFLSFHHEAAPTTEHVAALEKDLVGNHCKNLFMRNSRGDQLYLLIAPHDKPLDMKLVARAIGSTRLSFAVPELLKEVMGLEPGSVSPFGLVNDGEKRVHVLLDSDICAFEAICFHPNTNEATTSIDLKGLEHFLKTTGHQYEFITVAPRS